MTLKRPSGPSGRPLSHAEQLARGRLHVALWLDATDARCLDVLAEGGSRAEAVRQAIRSAYKQRK